jgi:5'-3' exonuclease
MKWIGIIDADSLLYQACFVNEEKVDGVRRLKEQDKSIALRNTLATLKKTINNIKVATRCAEYRLLITGPGNFRYDIATIKPYKGNRKKEDKPFLLKEATDYIKAYQNAQEICGREADDYCAELNNYYNNKDGYRSLLLHIDKDLNTIPGYHYNYSTKKFYRVTEFQAIRFFYMQMLEGDTADNIEGVKYIGKAKAKELLRPCKTPEELDLVVAKAFKFNKRKSYTYDQMVETGRLLHMQRHAEDWWTPITTKESFDELQPD